MSAYPRAAGEPWHERTFDGHATAAGAGLLEHTFGKLRAAPLSREFLRRLVVEEGAPAILDPIVSNSQEAADRELEPFRSRIINDACIHEIGRAHVCTPVTNAHHVCCLLPE